MDEVHPPPSLTDAQIVAQVRAGHVQAYGVLVERYERGVLAAVLPWVRDPHTAQDLVQDVFLKGYLKLASLRVGANFGGWLLKIARREAIHSLRRRRLAIAADNPAAQADPAATSLFDDEKQRLLTSVRRLPAHERLLVNLRYFDGHSVKEIARVTGRPVGTVTKQLSRAIERLRREMGSLIPYTETKP